MEACDSGTPEPAPGVPPGQVSVVVIGFDDAAHIADAVRSALAQGPAVAEVVAVDDASTDRTGPVLDELAAREPRLRVIHRTVNSGGCGAPRNDGLRVATAPYVMFLDSDDTLPEGAAAALLRAALRYDAPVAAGLCVRRELPSGRDTRWQPGLYRRAAVHRSPEHRPALLHDTLCVNKLYARAFLAEHGITFPEGPFIYEDFVFTARVLAALPRVATVPDTVYLWHVRRDAAAPSISLDRERVANWQARVRAHRRSVEVFREAGSEPLARAARVKFLDHDLRMYVRELPARGPGYRAEWWRVTRDHLGTYEEAELRAARPPARWIARAVLAADAPRDLDRLAQLAARPPRLLPPYATADGAPVWAPDLPGAALDGLTGPAAVPTAHLPVAVDGELGAAAFPCRGPRAELRLRVHDLYGRLTADPPRTVDLTLRRRDGSATLRRNIPLTTEKTAEETTEEIPEGTAEGAAEETPEGTAGEASWTARAVLGLGALAALGRRDGSGADPQSWDIRVQVRCASGDSFRTSVRATGALRRTAVPSPRFGLLLVRPHATAAGSLTLRLAPGMRSAAGIALRRLRRTVRRPGGAPR
ncbi:transferase [Streptomyces albireticuli]|uniref:Transferase n=1 Tax=Streptomyces albireticuli TaxID=1940 RepID=A0A1Z2L6B9_9ACTN|nr:glycosyltransferase [Streptomyces albireticuli]ARZ69839.1 transferase [Streptomyces albireticuli]